MSRTYCGNDEEVHECADAVGGYFNEMGICLIIDTIKVS